MCDDSDLDADNDMVNDDVDTHPADPYQCAMGPDDLCDDCASGTYDPQDDGDDYDADGICDLSDPPPVADTDDTDLPADTDDTDTTGGTDDTPDTDTVGTDGVEPDKKCGCATGGEPSMAAALAALWLIRRRRRA